MSEPTLELPDGIPSTREEMAYRLNSAVVAVYAPIAPLIKEYEMREADALAFAAADFQGDPPARVAAFLSAAGLPAVIGTQLILQQAGKLHAALPELADIRMQKFRFTARDPGTGEYVLPIGDCVQLLTVKLARIATIAKDL